MLMSISSTLLAADVVNVALYTPPPPGSAAYVTVFDSNPP